MHRNVIKNKTFVFAILIVNLCRRLQGAHKEFVISRQLLKSGTAPGALVREAEYAESKKDFIHKMSVALKEANESDYWLSILYKTNFIASDEFTDLNARCIEIIKILTTIIKTSKANLRA